MIYMSGLRILWGIQFYNEPQIDPKGNKVNRDNFLNIFVFIEY